MSNDSPPEGMSATSRSAFVDRLMDVVGLFARGAISEQSARQMTDAITVEMLAHERSVVTARTKERQRPNTVGGSIFDDILNDLRKGGKL
jgi:hypothetical protein